MTQMLKPSNQRASGVQENLLAVPSEARKQWKLTPLLRVDELNAPLVCGRFGCYISIVIPYSNFSTLTYFRSWTSSLQGSIPTFPLAKLKK